VNRLPLLVQDDPKLPDDSGDVPKLNGVVGGSIPSREIISLLEGKQAKWSKAHHVFQQKKKEKKIIGCHLKGLTYGPLELANT
jgi:hypothetical protein